MTALRRCTYLSTTLVRPTISPPHFNATTFFARSVSRTTVAMAPQPKFAEGSDEAALTRDLDRLVSGGGRWALTDDGQGVQRSFKFKTFAKNWDFMAAVSLRCKFNNHHPEWSNVSQAPLFLLLSKPNLTFPTRLKVYNTTFIRWTTHSPPGLSAKDTSLALLCDTLAEVFGEIQEQSPAEVTCQLKGLADKTASMAGDCCVPKK